jgi:tol-pal system protein YbgF
MSPPRRARPAFLLAALALLAGCSGQGVMGARTADRPPAEVQELRARVLELQRQAAVTEVELERLSRQVAALEARLGISPGGAGARPAPAPAPRATAPSRSSGAAPPALREPEFEVEDIAPAEPSRRPAPPPAAPPRAVEEPAPSGRRPAAAAQEVTAEAQALYDRGYTLYHQGRYVDAESSFQRFIQSHPATELTDNAHYWIGESRLARGDVSGALAAFRETVERYPDGNKVPDALLKVGEAMAALGDGEGAREAYQEVLRRFAGTTAAAVAEDRLRAIP